MSLKERITDDMKAAMRAKEAERLGTIRMLLAAMKQKDQKGASSKTEPYAAGRARSGLRLESSSCEKRYEYKQSPEQKVAPINAGATAAVGVTIHEELSVCHDWFFVWPSSVEKECLNGIGVKRWQFLHAPAEVCIVGGGRVSARAHSPSAREVGEGAVLVAFL